MEIDKDTRSSLIQYLLSHKFDIRIEALIDLKGPNRGNVKPAVIIGLLELLDAKDKEIKDLTMTEPTWQQYTILKGPDRYALFAAAATEGQTADFQLVTSQYVITASVTIDSIERCSPHEFKFEGHLFKVEDKAEGAYNLGKKIRGTYSPSGGGLLYLE